MPLRQNTSRANKLLPQLQAESPNTTPTKNPPFAAGDHLVVGQLKQLSSIVPLLPAPSVLSLLQRFASCLPERAFALLRGLWGRLGVTLSETLPILLSGPPLFFSVLMPTFFSSVECHSTQAAKNALPSPRLLRSRAPEF
jgi:hypothetical protein